MNNEDMKDGDAVGNSIDEKNIGHKHGIPRGDSNVYDKGTQCSQAKSPHLFDSRRSDTILDVSAS